MKNDETNLMILTGVFVTALVISNILASKVIGLFGLEFPAAVVAYPVTFLMTDVIGEIYGKKTAQKVVYIGFGCEILALILTYIAIALPSASYMTDYAAQYKSVLGTTLRMAVASLAAYTVSQSWDVIVFHKFRKGSWAKHKFARNNISTMTSQIIDTVIFISIAFIGVVSNIGLMMISQYVIKLLLALADTPFFYLLTKGSEKQNPIEE